MLVASTRKARLSPSYSARVMLTVSVDGGGVVVAGLMVNVALRVTPFKVALIVAVAVAVTETVGTVNVPDDAPAAIVMVAGTVARVVLLARFTTVAAGAAALNVTVPWTELPPTTELGFNVTAETVSAGGGGGCCVAGVTVTLTSRLPS